MKKIVLSGLLLISTIISLHAQLYTPSGVIGVSNANVGIGTSTPESGYKIDVNGSATIGNTGSTRVYMGTLDTNTSYIQSRNITVNKNLSIFADNVGVGTATPESGYKIDVNGSATIGNPSSTRFYMGTLNENTSYIQSRNSAINKNLSIFADNVGVGTATPESGYKIDVNGSATIGNPSSTRVYMGTLNENTSYIQSRNSAINKNLSIFADNVGIGTLAPDSKLTVKGKIHAEEVKVDLAVPADYVFEKYYLGQSSLKPDYTLLTLSEVEKFTEANHHLPDVPSAKEIKENGLLLGEMSNVLLQKIEELTLYVIEQNKSIEGLKEQLKVQNAKTEKLETAKK
jgi:hypothetical protein